MAEEQNGGAALTGGSSGDSGNNSSDKAPQLQSNTQPTGTGNVGDPALAVQEDPNAPPPPESGDPEPQVDLPGGFNFRRYGRLGLSDEQLKTVRDKFDALSPAEKLAENERIAGLSDSDVRAEVESSK